MSETSSIVSKIAITFTDGSFLELVDTVRFVQIRDNLRIASVTNNQLNEQIKKLEQKIADLEQQNETLDNNNQALINKLHSVEPIEPMEFKQPLP